YLGAQQIEILRGTENILVIECHMPGGALVRIEVVHAVEDTQQRGFAASRRTDEGGHFALIKRTVDVLEGAVIAVEEIQIPDRNLLEHFFGIGGSVGDRRYSE